MLFSKMETIKAGGKRRMKEVEGDEEEEEEDEDVVELDSGEDNKKMKGPSGRKGSSSGGSRQRCCQVDNCTTDMTYARSYHRRHKVCEFHAKAPAVDVAGLRQRFCQQCSRTVQSFCSMALSGNARNADLFPNMEGTRSCFPRNTRAVFTFYSFSSMSYRSSMKQKRAVAGVWLDIMSVAAKAHMSLMEKDQAEKGTALSTILATMLSIFCQSFNFFTKKLSPIYYVCSQSSVNPRVLGIQVVVV
ncbi:unnamed protein product [Camellia sinensis]